MANPFAEYGDDAVSGAQNPFAEYGNSAPATASPFAEYGDPRKAHIAAADAEINATPGLTPQQKIAVYERHQRAMQPQGIAPPSLPGYQQTLNNYSLGVTGASLDLIGGAAGLTGLSRVDSLADLGNRVRAEQNAMVAANDAPNTWYNRAASTLGAMTPDVAAVLAGGVPAMVATSMVGSWGRTGNEIDEARRNGAQITPGQEYLYRGAHAALSGGLAYGGGKLIASGGGALAKPFAAALRPIASEAAARIGGAVIGDTIGNIGIGQVGNVAGNVVNQQTLGGQLNPATGQIEPVGAFHNAGTALETGLYQSIPFAPMAGRNAYRGLQHERFQQAQRQPMADIGRSGYPNRELPGVPPQPAETIQPQIAPVPVPQPQEPSPYAQASPPYEPTGLQLTSASGKRYRVTQNYLIEMSPEGKARRAIRRNSAEAAKITAEGLENLDKPVQPQVESAKSTAPAPEPQPAPSTAPDLFDQPAPRQAAPAAPGSTIAPETTSDSSTAPKAAPAPPDAPVKRADIEASLRDWHKKEYQTEEAAQELPVVDSAGNDAFAYDPAGKMPGEIKQVIEKYPGLRSKFHKGKTGTGTWEDWVGQRPGNSGYADWDALMERTATGESMARILDRAKKSNDPEVQLNAAMYEATNSPEFGDIKSLRAQRTTAMNRAAKISARLSKLPQDHPSRPKLIAQAQQWQAKTASLTEYIKASEQRAKVVSTDPQALPPGTTFTLLGERYRVEQTADGFKVARDGSMPDIPLDAMERVPVDQGSVKIGAAPSEAPSDAAEPPAEAARTATPPDEIPFSAKSETDLFGRPVFNAKPGGQEVMPFKAASDAQRKADAARAAAEKKAAEAPAEGETAAEAKARKFWQKPEVVAGTKPLFEEGTTPVAKPTTPVVEPPTLSPKQLARAEAIAVAPMARKNTVNGWEIVKDPTRQYGGGYVLRHPETKRSYAFSLKITPLLRLAARITPKDALNRVAAKRASKAADRMIEEGVPETTGAKTTGTSRRLDERAAAEVFGFGDTEAEPLFEEGGQRAVQEQEATARSVRNEGIRREDQPEGVGRQDQPEEAPREGQAQEAPAAPREAARDDAGDVAPLRLQSEPGRQGTLFSRGKNAEAGYTPSGEPNASNKAIEEIRPRLPETFGDYPLRDAIRGVGADHPRLRELEANGTAKAVQEAAALARKNVVWFDGLSKNVHGFKGLGEQADNIYLNVNAEKPHMAVLGHEILHNLRREAPDVYNAIVAAYRKSANSTRFIDKAIEKSHTYRTSDPAYLEEEILGDTLGDRFTEPQFWREVGAKLPASVWSRARTAITGYLSRFMAWLRGNNYETGRLYNDVATLRRELAGYSAEYIKRRQAAGEIFRMAAKRAENPSEKQSVQASIIGQKGVGSLDPQERQTALDSLSIAQAMDGGGQHTPEQIRFATGWFKGSDGKWRFEISDKNMKVVADVPFNTTAKLSDLIEHPKLLEAYPQLRGVEVRKTPNTPTSSWDNANNRINLGAESPNFKKALLHEVQHAIQRYEGFTPGISPERVSTKGNISARDLEAQARALVRERDAIHKIPKGYYDNATGSNYNLYERLSRDQFNQWRSLDDRARQLRLQAAWERRRQQHQGYIENTGEVEARQVEERSELTETELRQTPLGGTKADAKFSVAPEAEAVKAAEEPTEERRVQKIADGAKEALHSAKRFFTLEAAPRLSEAGHAEQVQSHANAKAANPYVRDYLAAQIFDQGDYKTPEAMQRTGAIVRDDNILGVYDQHLSRRDMARQSAETATQRMAELRQQIEGLPEDAPARERNRLVRQLNKTIQDRGNYRRAATNAQKDADAVAGAHDLAELQRRVEAARSDKTIMRHLNNWREKVSPLDNQMYNELRDMDPDAEAPARGRNFGVFAHLTAVDANGMPLHYVEGAQEQTGIGRAGNPKNPAVRRDRFARRAGGTGQYSDDPLIMLSDGFGSRWNEVTKLRLYKGLIDKGDAQLAYGKNELRRMSEEQLQRAAEEWNIPYESRRQAIRDIANAPKPESIKGEPVDYIDVEMPRSTKEGGSVLERRRMYLRKSLFREMRTLLDTDLHLEQNPFAKFLTGIQMASGVDAVSHTMNQWRLATNGLAQPEWSRRIPIIAGIRGVADMAKTVRDMNADTPQARADLAEMAQKGYIRPEFPNTGGLQRFPIFKWTQHFIHRNDTAIRLLLYRRWKAAVKAGIAPKDARSERNFVGQLGEYNARLMGPLANAARQLGASPFIVAGRTFNRAGIRWLTGDPGFSPTTWKASAQMRTAGLTLPLLTFALPALANFIATGNVTGRAGTPFGAWDTGEDDKDGNHVIVDLAQMTGVRRGMRATGINALIDGIRQGQDANQIVGEMAKEAGRTFAHPYVGPAVSFATKAAGVQLDARGTMEPRTIPGGGVAQIGENLRAAAESQNPMLYSAGKTAASIPATIKGEAREGEDALSQLTQMGMGAGVKQLVSGLGIKSARGDRSAAMQYAHELLTKRLGSGMTDEQVRKMEARRPALRLLRSNPAQGKRRLEELVAAGDLSEVEAQNLIRHAGMDDLPWAVRSLDAREAALVYEKSTPAEQAQIRKQVADKIAHSTLAPKDQDALYDELGINKPVETDLERRIAPLRDKRKKLADAKEMLNDPTKRRDAQQAMREAAMSAREQAQYVRLQAVAREVRRVRKQAELHQIDDDVAERKIKTLLRLARLQAA